MGERTPIERCIAAVRQGGTLLRGGYVADEAELELETLRSQIDKLQALNRRSPSPSSGVDVDVASRAIDNAILLASVYDGVAIDKDKVIADLAALHRALSSPTPTDAREAGGNDAT